MKKIILALICFIVITGCSESRDNLKLATGAAGGTYYPLGSAIAELLTDESDLTVNAYTGNASVSNTLMLDEELIDMALVQSNVAAWAVEGIGSFENEPVDSITGIASLYSEVIQIIVREEADIETFYDLEEKKVGLGKKDSGNYFDAVNLFEAHKMSLDLVEPYYLTFSESIDAMDKGELDAVFITSGIPTSSVSLMSSKVKINMLSIEDAILNKMISDYPFYTREVVPMNTYIGLSEDKMTLSTRALWICHDSLDEEIVYDMLNIFWTNYNRLSDVHQSTKELSINDALKGMSIPLHPGAVKYYKEHGLEVQD
ncbi:MAG: TAXI family TRAP transporter solute-binding subunit [Clostridiales bacterium]|nr:TAXI family TRAP transporter solute-binding subunit [Clostridiales bacterium]